MKCFKSDLQIKVQSKNEQGDVDILAKGSQEVFQSGQRITAFTTAAPYQIQDSPAFPWRGFMLDTSRHYFSKKTILRVSEA